MVSLAFALQKRLREASTLVYKALTPEILRSSEFELRRFDSKIAASCVNKSVSEAPAGGQYLYIC